MRGKVGKAASEAHIQLTTGGLFVFFLPLLSVHLFKVPVEYL